MAAVVLACGSAVSFGAMSVAVRFGLRRSSDAEVAALAMSSVAFVVTGLIGLTAARGFDAAELWPFVLAGVIAPGLSQILFVRAVREAGAARTSVLMGTAPLVAVAIALTFLGEPVRAPLLVGAALIVAGGVALANERVRPEDFRRLGVLFALATTVLFAVRDNVLRSFVTDTEVDALVAAPSRCWPAGSRSRSTWPPRAVRAGRAATAAPSPPTCRRACCSGSRTPRSSRPTTAAG